MKKNSQFIKFREILMTLTCAIIFLICVAMVARELPFSPVFSYHGNDIGFVRALLEENKKRIIESRRFLKEYANRHALAPLNSSYDLVVVIVTMNKMSHSKDDSFMRRIFLPQTLAAALLELKNRGQSIFESSIITLCNVNVPPGSNRQAMKYSNFVKTFKKNYANIYGDIYDKEKDDYRFCLEQAHLNFKSNYILMLEDDVIMNSGSTLTLSYFIKNIRHQVVESEWMSIKLYHPKKWLGYSNEVNSILELVATSTVLGSLVHVILRTCKIRCKAVPIHILQAFFILLSMVSCLILGRQNVIKWRGFFYFTYSLTKAQGCCTQAILYNHALVPSLLRYLSKVQCSQSMPLDLALDEFANLYDLRQYMLEPNLCNHVGFLSTFNKDSHKAIDFL